MKSYTAGEIVWHQGDPSRFVVEIVSGHLDIVGHSEGGEELIHRRVGPGEYLGDMSALDGAPHSATVVAASDCQLNVFTTEQFRKRLETEPGLAVHLLKQQNQRVRLLSDRRLESAYLPIRNRLANHLLREFEGANPLPKTHEQLARELGTTRESVTKALKQLAKAGAVVLHRGKVELRNQEVLESQ